MISAIRLFLLVSWTLFLMFIAPFFILITLHRQFPLIVARTLFPAVFTRLAGIKIKTFGKENILKNQPAIYIANHCSHLDIGCLCLSLPVNLHFIGKKELAWMPIVGWYMYVAGHIFIDRSNKKKAFESLKQAAIKIKNGKNVVMYPEGTRSKTGELGDFKKGAFYLAIMANVSIVPVHIEGTFKVWPSGSSTITPGDVTVRIGKPIDSSKYTNQTIKDFVLEAREAILKLKEEVGDK